MSVGFASFKHHKLPISIKIPVTIWQIVYTYMTAKSPNYVFANLVAAWLYVSENMFDRYYCIRPFCCLRNFANALKNSFLVIHVPMMGRKGIRAASSWCH